MSRYRAELVTDNRQALGEHLETVTGERVEPLERVFRLQEVTITATEPIIDNENETVSGKSDRFAQVANRTVNREQSERKIDGQPEIHLEL